MVIESDLKTTLTERRFEATPAGATWRDVLVFRDYGTTELHTSLVRCVDHRDRAQTARSVARPRSGTAPLTRSGFEATPRWPRGRRGTAGEGSTAFPCSRDASTQ
jgi:hypothetical protein